MAYVMGGPVVVDDPFFASRDSLQGLGSRNNHGECAMRFSVMLEKWCGPSNQHNSNCLLEIVEVVIFTITPSHQA